MKDEGKHIDYELLGKYLSGEASPEENRQVELWKNASKDNIAEFERLSRLWKEADNFVNITPAKVNTEAAWTTLQSRLFGEEIEAETRLSRDDTETSSSLRRGILSGLAGRKKRHEQKEVIAVPSLSGVKTRGLFYYAIRTAAVLVIGFLIYTLVVKQGGAPGEVEVIAENKIKVTDLPDDSRITLNENSKITYPEKFEKDERSIQLAGEAYFEVKPATEKPFVVHAQNSIVRVLGTSFNVRAFETETEVSVTVEEGTVRFSDEDDVAYVVLGANEKGILNRETGHIEKYERTEGGEMFWRSRTIIFRDTKLSTVFRTLEKLYDTKIIIINDAISSCMLTGKYEDMDVEDILEKIAISLNLTIQKNNNTFEISGEGC